MTGMEPRVGIRRVTTAELSAREVGELRALFDQAWAGDQDGPFTDDDWAHATGGMHVLADVAGRIVAHGSVVPRTLFVAGRPLSAGYVEAVATLPEEERRGHGSAVMAEIDAVIRAGYELGALSTGIPAFYERRGWERWAGPTFVRTADGDVRTPDEDGGVMILRTQSTPPIDLSSPIACRWRPGDAW